MKKNRKLKDMKKKGCESNRNKEPNSKDSSKRELKKSFKRSNKPRGYRKRS